MSQEEGVSSPLFLAALASKGGMPVPDRPTSRTTPSLSREVKVLVVGSSGVGKSSLIRREVHGDFDEETQLTMGTERYTTKIEFEDEEIELALYDTVGQERFRTLSTTLYRNAQAVLLCFDSSNANSFAAVDKWYVDVERNAPQDALILLVATRADLPKVVSNSEARQKAAEMGVHFMETSAKTGQNVTTLFALVASAIAGKGQLRLQQSTYTLPQSPALPSKVHDRVLNKTSYREDARTHAEYPRSSSPIRLTSSLEGNDETNGNGMRSTCWGFIAPQDAKPMAGRHSPSPSLSSRSDHMDPIPIPEDGISLAEVIIEHASQRARNLAGGLRRRNTVDQPDLLSPSSTLSMSAFQKIGPTLEPFWEGSNEGSEVSPSPPGTDDSAQKSPILSRATSQAKSAYRQCALGCGALLEEGRSNHEHDECWLRQMECSLGCGAKFPWVDCLAHERESCALRSIRCSCGEKLRASDLPMHTMSFKGRSIALWSEIDVLHFIVNVFANKESEKRFVDFSQILQKKINGKELVLMQTTARFPEIFRKDDVAKAVSSALLNYSFAPSSSSNGTPVPQGPIEYVDWVDDFEPESKHRISTTEAPASNALGAQMLFGLNVTTAQRRLQLVAHNQLVPSRRGSDPRREPSPLTKVEEVDKIDSVSPSPGPQHEDLAAMWRLWQQEVTSKATRASSVPKDTVEDEQEEETSREVLVPLSLGSRTVAVRTIRFKSLQLNSQDLVGSGSFGSVYFGRYRGAQVAVKHLHCQDVSERDLLREAAVMTSISGHPHVLRFLGVCLERPNISFISEALECSLEEWLRRDRMNHVEPLSEILRYAEEAASGIYHLHLEMIVHRDISARNLLLDSGNPRRVKVCDFGLARVLPRRNAPGNNIVSQIGLPPPVGGSMNLSGPLRWMSPESLRPGNDGLTRFSFASDVYSFGITAWELLSRDIPYPLLQPHEAAIAVLMEDMRPPRAKLRPDNGSELVALLTSQGPKCTTRLVGLLERAWDKDPAKRPAMREIVTELASLRASCKN